MSPHPPGREAGRLAAPDTYDDAATWLRERYPDIASGLLFAQEADPRLDDVARWAFAALKKKCDAAGRGLSASLEALARVSFEFVRLQGRFLKTGKYVQDDARGLFERLYGRPEVMEGYYLDGLLLTYAFWTNHARLLSWFRDRFVAALPTASRTLEVGTGHGLMAVALLQSRPDAVCDGLDVSPSALRFSAALAGANGVEAGRLHLFEANALRPSSWPGGAGCYDGAVCCEVLEHVEAPATILQGLASTLKPGGRAFLTTVANVAAEDHIFLFHDVGHIRGFIEEAGLEVVEDLPLVLRGFANCSPLPINYAAIVRAPAA